MGLIKMEVSKITEMILDGTLCEGCGEVFEDIMLGEESPGYPRLCVSCKKEEDDE